MGGLNEERGLSPRIVESLFEKIDGSYQVQCSYYEIYNEKISDLLTDESAKGKIVIRETAEKGVYVEGTSVVGCHCSEEVLSLMRRGAQNRRTGATRMNQESSRSHLIFEMRLEQESTRTSTSKVCLVDLAGSER